MIESLYSLDDEYRRQYGQVLCGVDEAGRGPLAGPVCCAAVILLAETRLYGLNDSKQLTERVRERLYEEIMDCCLAYRVVMIGNETIDRLNILNATMLGMSQAVGRLDPAPDTVLVDGNRVPGLGMRCFSIVGGDAMSASIAAASVLAKVSRDRHMTELDDRYPGYGFARHKGYATAQHYEAIERLGVTPVHRRSFKLYRETQLSLFQ